MADINKNSMIITYVGTIGTHVSCPNLKEDSLFNIGWMKAKVGLPKLILIHSARGNNAGRYINSCDRKH